MYRATTFKCHLVFKVGDAEEHEETSEEPLGDDGADGEAEDEEAAGDLTGGGGFVLVGIFLGGIGFGDLGLGVWGLGSLGLSGDFGVTGSFVLQGPVVSI